MPRILALMGLTVCLLGMAVSGPAQEAKRAEPVRLGMVSTLFNDIPAPLIEFMRGPFNFLVKEFTGLEAQLKVGGNAIDVGKRLNDKELDFGVFHSFEFGWARQKYPNLRPLMIAVSKPPMIHAYLVVRSDSDIKSFHDVKGKDIGFPRKTKEHCRVFMERNCADCGQANPKSFFGQIVVSNTVEDALDDICRGKLPAVVVDTFSMDAYEQIKPGCFARVKVAKQSEPFPPAVIAYREGAVDADTLQRFRDGMINANKEQRGRDMMSTFKMTGFEPVPDNYDQMIAEVLRHYPAPEAAEKSSQN